MLTEQAIDRFGDKARITRLLELSSGRVYQWGPVVPKSSAPDLAALSGGDLEYSLDFYKELKRDGGHWKKLQREYRKSGLKKIFRLKAKEEIALEEAAA